MADKTFSVQVDAIIAATEKRLAAVCRMTVQDVIIDAQTSVGKGGRMRVDTGFLRASGRISFTGMPSGPQRGDKNAKPGAYPDNTDATILQIGEFKPGGPALFFGWTANYAKYREAYDGFLSAAIQNFQTYFAKNVERVKRQIK